MGLLIVLVALGCVSPVLAGPAPVLPIAFDPPAACPGTTVTVTGIAFDVVVGGMSVAAMSPLDSEIILSSNPAGLITNQECNFVKCTFVVSESASCGHYIVTVTIPDEGLGPSVSGPFDVSGPCCAVGGCVQPVNTFALLSPWLAALGLIGCIGTVVVVAKKRHL